VIRKILETEKKTLSLGLNAGSARANPFTLFNVIIYPVNLARWGDIPCDGREHVSSLAMQNMRRLRWQKSRKTFAPPGVTINFVLYREPLNFWVGFLSV